MKKFLLTTLALGLLGGFLLWQGNFSKTSAHIAQTADIIDSQTTIVTTHATSASNDFVPVVRVIDGDTIVVSIAGTDDTVRLLGMDTPETVDSRKPVQCFGPEASAETKSLLDGQSVRLVADQTQANRDKYGRLLRYVYLPDGTFVDLILVQLGFAREYTYENKPYEFQQEFLRAQSTAQETGRGLWSPKTCNGGV